jgi:ankyrin repeat protein
VKSSIPRQVLAFLELAEGVVNIDNQASNGETALTFAASQGDLSMMQLLIKYGASLKAKNYDEDFPIHCAARLAASDSTEHQALGYKALKYLLSQGASMFDKNKKYQTAYNLTQVQSKLLAVVKSSIPRQVLAFLELAEGVVNIDNQASNGETALTFAASQGDLSMMQLLIKYGASLKAKNYEEDFPIHCAARLAASENTEYQALGYKALKYLLSQGANIFDKNKKYQTAYSLTQVQSKLLAVVKSGVPHQVISFLELAEGVVNIDNSASNGETALTFAASRGDLAMIQLLIEYGASLKAINDDGDFPIHCAARMVASNDSNQKDLGLKVLQYLVSQGACLSDKNKKYQTAYVLCKMQPQELDQILRNPRSTVQSSPSHETKSSPLSELSMFNKSTGNSLNITLLKNVLIGDIEAVQELLLKEANPNFVYDTDNGDSLLMHLIKSDVLAEKHVEIIKLLLIFGANPAQANNKGHTAIEHLLEKRDVSDGVIEQITQLFFEAADSSPTQKVRVTASKLAPL